jgi:hypothetical protein
VSATKSEKERQKCPIFAALSRRTRRAGKIMKREKKSDADEDLPNPGARDAPMADVEWRT